MNRAISTLAFVLMAGSASITFAQAVQPSTQPSPSTPPTHPTTKPGAEGMKSDKMMDKSTDKKANMDCKKKTTPQEQADCAKLAKQDKQK